MEPLPRIHDALNAAGTAGTKQAALVTALWNLDGVLERVYLYLQRWRDGLAAEFRQLPREKAVARLAAAGVRHIQVRDMPSAH